MNFSFYSNLLYNRAPGHNELKYDSPIISSNMNRYSTYPHTITPVYMSSLSSTFNHNSNSYNSSIYNPPGHDSTSRYKSYEPVFPSDPAKTGPGMWFLLHTISLHAQSPERQRCYIWVLSLLSKYHPCFATCRKHIQSNLQQNPPEKYLMIKDGLFIHSIDFHNSVNKRLGKPIMDHKMAYQIYRNLETNICTADCDSSPTIPTLTTRPKSIYPSTYTITSVHSSSITQPFSHNPSSYNLLGRGQYIENKSYEPMFPSDPAKTGPGMWFLLHTISLHAQSPEQQRCYIWVLSLLSKYHPCFATCRKHIQSNLQQNPPEKYLMIKDGLFIHSIDFHNSVNKRLGKPIMDHKMAYQIYRNLETNICTANCYSSPTIPTLTTRPQPIHFSPSINISIIS